MPRWLLIAFLAFAVLVICGVRLRLLNFPLERDEGEYAYAGQLILEGIAPYKLVYSMKLPGVFLAYAGIMAVFGQTCAGIHFGLLLVNLATMAALFILARRILDLPGAVVAAAAYGFLTLSPALLGLAAHATHFVVLPALLGLWLLHRMADGGRGTWFNYIGAGLLFGLAFVMKQQGVFFGIFGGLWLIWIGVRAKAAPIWLGRRLGIYSLGCLAPFLGVCVWMKLAGVFPQFWFWTFAYARQYATVVPIRGGIFLAEEGIGLILHGAPLVCAAAALGTACLCLIRLPWNTRIFLGGLLVFSAMAVCPGLYFRHHYFIVAAPALALLAGLFVSWGGRYVRGTGARLWVACLPLFLAVLACAESLLAHRDIYFTLPPDRACRAIYGQNPLPESPLIARYLAEHTQPDEPVLVLGSEPQIYFYSHRHSSTGQIYMYPLVEAQAFARQMQADMIREIEKHPPACLVLVSVPTSWLSYPGSSHQAINWAAGYVNEHMRQVGLFELNRADTARPIWGAEAETTPLDTDFYVAVFKRSDPAPAGDRGRIAARNADLFHRFERAPLDADIIKIRENLASQPKDAQEHNNLGLDLAQLGNTDEALFEVRLAISLKPGDAAFHNNLGRLLLNKAQTNAAVQEWQEALRLQPTLPDAHKNLALACALEGNSVEAIRHWLNALRYGPEDAAVHQNLALAYAREGRTNAANNEWKNYERLTRRQSPGDAVKHNNLGNTLARQGKNAEALAEFQSAVALDPLYAKAHENLGIVCVKLGRTNDALAEFMTAARLQPDNGKAHSNLGFILSNLGRTSEAVQEWKTALRLDPGNADAKRGLADALAPAAHSVPPAH